MTQLSTEIKRLLPLVTNILPGNVQALLIIRGK